MPTQVIAAIQKYLENSNANTHGSFLTGVHSDEMIANTREAMADFFHCAPCEVVFGPNMTTLTFALVRAIGRELRQDDEILLTILDHDANFSPWKALEEKGVVIKVADIREVDCTLNLDDQTEPPGARLVLGVTRLRYATGLFNIDPQHSKFSYYRVFDNLDSGIADQQRTVSRERRSVLSRMEGGGRDHLIQMKKLVFQKVTPDDPGLRKLDLEPVCLQCAMTIGDRRPAESHDSLDGFGRGCHLATQVLKPNWLAISHFFGAD
jgi:hypothetical protein